MTGNRLAQALREQHAAAEKDRFNSQLLEILGSPEFRTATIQRLVAASIDAAEGFLVVDLAIDRVREEARGSAADLPSRILRSINAGCAVYAEMRGLPYKRVVGPMIRGWGTLMSFARQAGLTEEEGYAVMRDLLRKIPASHWSRAKDVDRELLAELKYGFSVIGLSKGGGKSPARS